MTISNPQANFSLSSSSSNLPSPTDVHSDNSPTDSPRTAADSPRTPRLPDSPLTPRTPRIDSNDSNSSNDSPPQVDNKNNNNNAIRSPSPLTSQDNASSRPARKPTPPSRASRTLLALSQPLDGDAADENSPASPPSADQIDDSIIIIVKLFNNIYLTCYL